MIKVHILTKCKYCDGELYIQEGERAKWILLDDFLDILVILN